MQKRLLLLTIVALASLVFARAALAQPTSKAISGDPLKINVWSDGSFQVFNATVPGFGQGLSDALLVRQPDGHSVRALNRMRISS